MTRLLGLIIVSCCLWNQTESAPNEPVRKPTRVPPPTALPPLKHWPVDVIEKDWGAAPDPRPVPQPNFETAADYIAWYDAAVAYAANDDARDHYGVFLYGDNEQEADRLAPDPDALAARDIKIVLSAPIQWYTDEHRGLAKWMYLLDRRFTHVVLAGMDDQYYTTRRRPDLELLADIIPPALGNARTLGQMLVVHAWNVERNSVDADRLPRALAANLVIGRHIAQGCTLEEQLFGVGQHTFVYDQVRRSLNSPIHVAEQWEDLVKALEQFDQRPVTLDVARRMYFAEAEALQLLQHFCTAPGPDGSPTVAAKVNMDAVNAYTARKYPGGRFRPTGIAELADADPRALARVIHAYYAGLRDILRQPFVVNLSEQITKLEAATIRMHPELDLLVTPIGMTVKTAFQAEAQRRLVYLFLKMVVPFKYTGKWPTSLDELSGLRVAESRVDPFSGKDMRLRGVNIAFVPYSVGPDGVDDGGDEAKDIVYWGRVAQEAYRRTSRDASSNGEAAAKSDESQSSGKQPAAETPATLPSDTDSPDPPGDE